MSITNELREWAEDNTLRDRELTTYPPQHVVHGVLETLLRIADRIDDEHESACGEAYGNGVQSVALPDMTAYVKLPVDADGEVIHIGDVMEGIDKYDSLKKVMGEVTTISFDATFDPDDSRSVGIRVWSDDRRSYHTAYLDPRASVYRHHREPTVEDVLREMLYKAHIYDEREMELLPDLIAEYAAKLRLVKEDE